MKVIKTTADWSKDGSGETSSSLDLFGGRKLPTAVKDRIRDEVGTYLVEQTQVALSEKKSPVSGETIPALQSKEYKALKKREVGNTSADLEFSGTMKDEITFKPTKDGIKLGVFGERAGAADGHNNFSGQSSLPKRRFLPATGQKFKSEIERTVDQIVADIVSEEMSFKESDFKDVTTKKELIQVLGQKFSNQSSAEIVLNVFRNEELLKLLLKLGLSRLLK